MRMEAQTNGFCSPWLPLPVILKLACFKLWTGQAIEPTALCSTIADEANQVPALNPKPYITV